MKVKIVKYSLNSYWYKNLVGKTLDVVQCDADRNDWHCEAEQGSLLKADCEIINEQKENNMKQEKTPHVHAEVIKAWADGTSIQWRRGDTTWYDCHPTDFYFSSEMELRIKPLPEFPKTTLTGVFLYKMFNEFDSSGPASHLHVANGVIKEFITSGQMDAYIAERTE